MSWGPLCVQLSMEIKIQKCIETLNNILWPVVAKHFEKRVWVFFFQEDYAPLSICVFQAGNWKTPIQLYNAQT